MLFHYKPIYLHFQKKELSKEFDRLSFKNYFVKIKIPIIDWYLFIYSGLKKVFQAV
ncbi:hypothetical protein M20_1060 [Lactococcus lactis subsp. lactis]|uniref:Uncharacterized protein n=1 Tax=Lactococcus lactis subsp. lactis TaxID=1360 RepID=A0A0V8E6C0_LACLL|nr:hypothetical protein M20_1060 [Lactococcus lactis subsp. lactis]